MSLRLISLRQHMAALLCCMLLGPVACAGTQGSGDAPTAAISLTPKATIIPSPTLTATAVRTPSPTSTVTASATVTMSPTATVPPTGTAIGSSMSCRTVESIRGVSFCLAGLAVLELCCGSSLSRAMLSQARGALSFHAMGCQRQVSSLPSPDDGGRRNAREEILSTERDASISHVANHGSALPRSDYVITTLA